MGAQEAFGGTTPNDNRSENIKEKVYTLEAVSSDNMSLKLAEIEKSKGWIHWLDEKSTYDKELMKDLLEKLQGNKDFWGEPINVKLVKESGEIKFIEFSTNLDEDKLPDDYEKADIDRDDRDNSSNEERKLADIDYDHAMKLLVKKEDNFSIETEVLQDEPHAVVKANIDIEDGCQATGHATSKESNISSSREVEIAETRAVKRAIKNTGVLVEEDTDGN